MWYVIRGWHVLASGNVCCTVVDHLGDVHRISLPYNRTTADQYDPIIRYVIASRRSQLRRVP